MIHFNQIFTKMMFLGLTTKSITSADLENVWQGHISAIVKPI